MVWLLMPFWLVSSLALIFLVLLHSGRGGGLSDLLSGGAASSQAQGSTVMEKNLDRLTVIVALVFMFSTAAIGLFLDT